jgi:hypothetical protein
LESLGTEADASTLRSALNGEVVWVMIPNPRMRIGTMSRACRGPAI